jgi:hypothetical protein
MAGILETLGSAITPDAIGQIGKAIGADPSQVTKGLGAAGPAVLGSLTEQASAPGGLDSIMGMLSSAGSASGGSPDDMIGSLLGALTGGGNQNDMLNNVLGGGVNAVSGTLSKSLGFDVKPLLTMAIPLIMGMITKTAKEKNLDAAGVQSLLKTETQTYMDNPANKETVEMVQGALKAGKESEAIRKSFDEGEWTKVRMAPVAAMYLVATASKSGAVGSAQELEAAVNTVKTALADVSPASFLNTAFGGGLTKSEVDLLKKDEPPVDTILGAIKDGVAAVSAKNPAEAAAYKKLILDVANNTANAAKEGGFLGIGGKQVSKEEAAAISAITAAIG